MTHLAALLHATDTPVEWLARHTGYSRGAVRQWVAGKCRTPPEVLEWLERRLADPPPSRKLLTAGRPMWQEIDNVAIVATVAPPSRG